MSRSRKRSDTDHDPFHIEPKTKNQQLYLTALENEYMTIATGSAGTGKTFMACMVAGRMLYEKKISKIVLARPAEGPCKSLGFEPGDKNEKMEGWVMPLAENFKKLYGEMPYKSLVAKGTIEMLPLHQVTGRSYDNCFIILDEAQQMNIPTAKSVVTRLGKYTKLVLCGDIKQQHIHGESGLKYLLDRVYKYKLQVNHIEFTLEDCVRSEQCKMWLKVFEKEEG